MRIKKEFLNEESLKPYGFRKEYLYGKDERWVEYWKECPYCDIFIQRCTGEVAICINGDCDCTNIDDIVYHLLVDGVVDI